MKNVKFFSDKRPENNPMTVTYLEEADLIFNGTEKKMYFVNMAFNLIIDKENIEENGDNKIYFRDNHENPMYISRRMFLNVNDAEKEMERIINERKEYQNANTLMYYIKERHNNIIDEKNKIIS